MFVPSCRAARSRPLAIYTSIVPTFLGGRPYPCFPVEPFVLSCEAGWSQMRFGCRESALEPSAGQGKGYSEKQRCGALADFRRS